MTTVPVGRRPPPGTIMATSPSGSLCPYPYLGGQLHPLKYGGYHRDKATLSQVMSAEEQFIANPAQPGGRRVWVDLYETAIDRGAADALAAHLGAIRPKVVKLCLVGCTWQGRRRIRAAMKHHHLGDWPIRFFTDPEAAKRWLVGKPSTS